MSANRYVADRLYRELNNSGDYFVLSRDQVRQILSLLDGTSPVDTHTPAEICRQHRKQIKELTIEHEQEVDQLKKKISELEDDFRPYAEMECCGKIRVLKGTF